jgi:hypothetical protein
MGQADQDCQGQADQDCQGRPASKELPGKGCQDRTALTTLSGPDCPDRAAKTGLLEKTVKKDRNQEDCQKSTAGKDL